MKNIIALTVAVFIATTGLFAQTKAGKIDTSPKYSLYTCPTHPEVTGHKAGTCPKCGMALVLSKKEEMKANQVKNYSCPSHTEVTSHNPGQCPKCGKKLNLSAKEQMKAEVSKTYTCPMHPQVALTKDGVCPKCGTALVEKKKN
jgi:Cu(I)/Ag(I) efflux system membrane fusion protein/Cu+-exporting ATPase